MIKLIRGYQLPCGMALHAVLIKNTHLKQSLLSHYIMTLRIKVYTGPSQLKFQENHYYVLLGSIYQTLTLRLSYSEFFLFFINLSSSRTKACYVTSKDGSSPYKNLILFLFSTFADFLLCSYISLQNMVETNLFGKDFKAARDQRHSLQAFPW